MSDGGKPTLFSLDELGQRRAVTLEPARVLCGDMLDVLAGMPPESVHAIVCDPPYGLSNGQNATRGFMGKEWDARVPGPEYWRACLRVAKPGAHLLAFGGTRTAHRLACAVEDGGWEVRDSLLAWVHGQGFPKSHNLDGDWQGWGTSLKPSWEPVYLARKPFKGTVAQCVCEHGCGALNIDGCRIGTEPAFIGRPGCKSKGGIMNGVVGIRVTDGGNGRWPANLVLDEAAARLLDEQTGELCSHGEKNAVNRRGLGYGSTSQGDLRGPMPASSGGPSRFFYTAKASRSEREAGLERFEPRNVNDGRDTPIDNPYQRGDTLRKCTHPTVKPIALMRWLVRLITPPGGLVLDPFTGSGSTGVAAVLEGARFVGVELSEEYAQLARARIAHAADEDDGAQLTLFERQELAPVKPRQGCLFGDDEP